MLLFLLDTDIKFFKKVQNKMHYAVSHQTAAEIIYDRADSEKEHMGLTSWKNSPNGKILETDVVIAKNYLSKSEIEGLELIVSSFLDLAESRARRNIPMTMNDWSSLLDKYLLLDNRDILKDAGKISHEIACDKALTEVDAIFKDETLWLTQKGMSKVFDCSTDNISLHLKNIFKDNELDEKSVVEDSSVTASDGFSGCPVFMTTIT